MNNNELGLALACLFWITVFCTYPLWSRYVFKTEEALQ